MRRAIPWVLAAVFLVGFIASFSELQRVRTRFGEVTRYQVSHRIYYRQFLILSELAEAKEPILVLGDSITERAELPHTIDGHTVINAGIGGVGFEEFERIIDAIEELRPYLIVVALGTNNTADDLHSNYTAFLSRLKLCAPRLLAIGVTPHDNADLKNDRIRTAANNAGVRFVDIPLPEGSTLPDRVHLNAAGYSKWIPALVAAISEQVS